MGLSFTVPDNNRVISGLPLVDLYYPESMQQGVMCWGSFWARGPGPPEAVVY